MTTEKTNYNALVKAIVPDLEYSAEFVPQSASRNAGKKEYSLNWKVTLKRGRVTLTTDYMQGIGHVPGRPHNYVRKLYYDLDRDQHAAQTGCGTWFQATDGEAHFRREKKIPPPALADVLSSLLLDAEVLDAGGFEEWANNYGYDTDSREAERTYNACLESGLKTRVLLGEGVMNELREALGGM